jgi:hypothetical protein
MQTKLLDAEKQKQMLMQKIGIEADIKNLLQMQKLKPMQKRS